MIFNKSFSTESNTTYSGTLIALLFSIAQNTGFSTNSSTCEICDKKNQVCDPFPFDALIENCFADLPVSASY